MFFMQQLRMEGLLDPENARGSKPAPPAREKNRAWRAPGAEDPSLDAEHLDTTLA